MSAKIWAIAKRKISSGRWYHLPAALTLSHFFIALGREDFGWSYMRQWEYWLDLAGIAWVAWSTWFFLSLCAALLKPFDLAWRIKMLKLLGTYLVVVVWFFVQLTVVLWFSWRQKWWEGPILFNEGPMALLVLALLLLYEIRKEGNATLPVAVPSPDTPIMLEGRVGSEVILIDPAEVLFIEIVGEQCVASLKDQRKLRLTAGMGALEAQLHPATFFRANRQILVHRQACGAYRTERSGRLQLNIQGRGEAVAVSQHKGASFKAWLKTT